MLKSIEKLDCTTISMFYLVVLGGMMAYTLYTMRALKGEESYNTLIGLMAVSLALVLGYNHMSCTQRTKVAALLFPFLILALPVFSIMVSTSFMVVSQKLSPELKKATDSIM
jgi:hypothetical protein